MVPKRNPMPSIKTVLRRKPSEDGKYPIAIRITKDRKHSFIHLGHNIYEQDWDKKTQTVKKSHPNSVRLNNFIRQKLAQASDTMIDIETKKDNTSAISIKKTIKPEAETGKTFLPLSQLYLQRLKEAGKYNQYTADKPRIKHFLEYVGSDIGFENISVSLLDQFEAHVEHKMKLSKRTAVNHIAVIRSVFSFAQKEGVIDPKNSPFGKGKKKVVFPETKKVGLSPDEIERLEITELNGYPHHCRNLWLVSYYFAGMRVSDVLRLQWSDFQDNRLYYAMGKNQKTGSLKIPEKAATILAEYQEAAQSATGLVFPELNGVDFDDEFITKRTIAFKTSAIDKCLRTHVAPAAKIGKKLTMHISRHSFGQNAKNIPVQILQKLYRHSSILTTIDYQSNFDNDETDDALDKVLSHKPQPKG